MKQFKYIMFLILAFASLSLQAKERFQIDAQGNSLIINSFDAYANCSAKFSATISVESNKIIITEKDISTQKTRCNCFFDITITVNQLNAGDYKLIIQREELKKFGYAKDTIYNIYSGDVKIRSRGTRLQPAIVVEQSECKNLPKTGSSQVETNEISVYPNPSSSTVSLAFNLAKDADVTIQIFNFLGKQLTSIQRNGLSAGANSITFSGKDLQPGMYIGKLITSNGRVSTFRLTWSK